MCYDNDARPPTPAGEAGQARGEEIVLASADGTRFDAYEARPEGRVRAQLLIYPDVRGLHKFYKDLALRFAEQGVAALAMDYFGRTAGLGARDESFEFRPHVEQMQTPYVLADASACLEHLRGASGASGSTIIMGFCLGGSLSLYSATQDWGLAGAIAFYAGFSRVLDAEGRTALDAAPSARTAVLGLFGGADQGIPVEQVEALDAALDSSGVEHEVVVYPGAPHSFFDRRSAEFADASADAWERMLGFIAAHATE